MAGSDKNMMTDNNMDGYEKIEHYNDEKINVLSNHYAKIIEQTGTMVALRKLKDYEI